jgi:hypothetical protein
MILLQPSIEICTCPMLDMAAHRFAYGTRRGSRSIRRHLIGNMTNHRNSLLEKPLVGDNTLQAECRSHDCLGTRVPPRGSHARTHAWCTCDAHWRGLCRGRASRSSPGFSAMVRVQICTVTHHFFREAYQTDLSCVNLLPATDSRFAAVWPATRWAQSVPLLATTPPLSSTPPVLG